MKTSRKIEKEIINGIEIAKLSANSFGYPRYAVSASSFEKDGEFIALMQRGLSYAESTAAVKENAERLANSLGFSRMRFNKNWFCKTDFRTPKQICARIAAAVASC